MLNWIKLNIQLMMNVLTTLHSIYIYISLSLPLLSLSLSFSSLVWKHSFKSLIYATPLCLKINIWKQPEQHMQKHETTTISTITTTSTTILPILHNYVLMVPLRHVLSVFYKFHQQQPEQQHKKTPTASTRTTSTTTSTTEESKYVL